MTIPHAIRISALVLATTGFYAYVGQLVPQKEVQPPQETTLGGNASTADMVKIGRGIMEGKGLCLTCHTIGKTGALRFPDLAGVDVRAKSRESGLSDVDYFAQAMYEPNAFIVPRLNPGMPVINNPPIGPTDQEILCVIAYLQSLGGTPTVTLQTTHRYRGATAPPGGAPAPAATPAPSAAPGEAQPEAPPTEGTQLRPDAILQPVVAHQSTARHDGAVTR